MAENSALDDLIGDARDLFKYGLSTYIDLEAEENRAKWQTKPIAEDNDIYTKGRDATVRKGEPSSMFQNVPMWAIYGAITTVIVVALIIAPRRA